MAEKSKAHKVLGGKKKGKRHKVHHVTFRKSANNNYIAENSHEPDEMGVTPPSEEHTYADLAGAQGHLAEHLPQEQPEPEPTPQAAAAPNPQPQVGAM